VLLSSSDLSRSEQDSDRVRLRSSQTQIESPKCGDSDADGMIRVTLQSPSKPFKALQSPSKPFKALQSPSKAFKALQALQSPSKPFKALQSPSKPFKALQSPSKPFKGLFGRFNTSCPSLHTPTCTPHTRPVHSHQKPPPTPTSTPSRPRTQHLCRRSDPPILGRAGGGALELGWA
jgi:hypothetical protein